MTGSRLFSPRLLAAGGVAVLAAVLGVALMLQNSGSACAAPPGTGQKKGVATYFFLEGTLGSCSYPSPPADDLYVALGPNQYSTAAACGTYIDVTGPQGKVRVKVIDSCPNCPVGHLDLSLTAFKKIAKQADGLVPITYRAVPGAATPAPISVRVKEGSSQHWLSLLIDNHSYQLSSVKVAGSGGTFRAAKREEWNYWTLPSGVGKGPFKVKITDKQGHTVTVSNIKLAVGKTQKTTAKLAGAPIEKVKVVKKPAAPKKPAVVKKTAAPAPVKTTTAPPRPKATTAAPAPTTAAPAVTAVDLAANTPDSCA